MNTIVNTPACMLHGGTGQCVHRSPDHPWAVKDGAFIEWLAERLVSVYGESPNADFVRRLHECAARLTEYGHGPK